MSTPYATDFRIAFSMLLSLPPASCDVGRCPIRCSHDPARASSRAVASAWSPTLLPSAPSSSSTFTVLNSVAQQCSQRHMGTCGGRSQWFVHTNPTPPAPSTPPLTLDRLYIEQPRHSREHQRPPRGTQSVAVPQGRFPAQRGSRHAGPSTRESAKPNHPPPGALRSITSHQSSVPGTSGRRLTRQ